MWHDKKHLKRRLISPLRDGGNSTDEKHIKCKDTFFVLTVEGGRRFICMYNVFASCILKTILCLARQGKEQREKGRRIYFNVHSIAYFSKNLFTCFRRL